MLLIDKTNSRHHLRIPGPPTRTGPAAHQWLAGHQWALLLIKGRGFAKPSRSAGQGVCPFSEIPQTTQLLSTPKTHCLTLTTKCPTPRTSATAHHWLSRLLLIKGRELLLLQATPVIKRGEPHSTPTIRSAPSSNNPITPPQRRRILDLPRLSTIDHTLPPCRDALRGAGPPVSHRGGHLLDVGGPPSPRVKCRMRIN